MSIRSTTTTGLPLSGSVSRLPLSAKAVSSSVRSSSTTRMRTRRLRSRTALKNARTSRGSTAAATAPASATRNGTVPTSAPPESVPPNSSVSASSKPPVRQAERNSASSARGSSRRPCVSGSEARTHSSSLQGSVRSSGTAVNDNSA